MFSHALGELRSRGLEGWTVAWSDEVAFFGRTSHQRKMLILSRPWAEVRPPALSRTTVLHEVAHVLAGPGVGHGPLWVREARRLGIAGNQCSPAGPYRPPALMDRSS